MSGRERDERAAEPTAHRRAVEDDDVRRLLESAGPRPEIPAADLASLRAAAREAWRAQARTTRRPPASLRRWVPALLAASVVAALGLGWRWLRPAAPGAEAPSTAAKVATIELARGDVRWTPAPEPGPAGDVAHVVGRALGAGARISTGAGAAPGRVALRLDGGGSLRLGPGSRLRLLAAKRVELESGVLYVDSDPARGGAGAIEIATALGRVHELGTQFEVRVEGEGAGSLRVRVREGSVSLVRPGGQHAVVAGEELSLRSDGTLARAAIDRHGPAWDWVLAASPAIAIEGRSLRAVLDWACRETGWRLRFEDRSLEQEAAAIRLHGEIAELRPDQAVEVVLAGAGLGHRVAGGELWITRSATTTGGASP